MAYPSTITAFNYPSPSDRLNNPSHSTLENLQSSTIGQIQAVVGLAGDAPGTIIGDLRSSSSDGGGHVQSANKGGTGQTTFTKGDLLVATSQSVLSKLAISSTAGEVLTARPTAATGLEWAAAAGATKIAIKTSSVILSGGAASVATVMFSTSILGSTIGTSNGVKFTGIIQNFSSDRDFTLDLNYGNNRVASVFLNKPGNATSLMSGWVQGAIVANGSSSTQTGYIGIHVADAAQKETALPVGFGFNQSTSSVESFATQNLTVTGRFVTNVAAINSITTGLFIVEKIV